MLRCFGGVPEWPKGSDCKSDAKASVVRIHPPPPVCESFLTRSVAGVPLSLWCLSHSLVGLHFAAGMVQW
jgi:hypothetical protein